MPKKKYIVKLEDAERQQLETLLRSGKHGARKLTRARILLHADAGCLDEEIVEALDVGRATVERVRQRFVERGLACLTDKQRPGAKPKLDDKGEARLIAEACSTPPEGRARWTLALLAERVIALELTSTYSNETVRRVLKKMNSNPGGKNSGASRRLAANSSLRWKTSLNFTPSPTTLNAQRSTLTRRINN
jgi:transposase